MKVVKQITELEGKLDLVVAISTINTSGSRLVAPPGPPRWTMGLPHGTLLGPILFYNYIAIINVTRRFKRLIFYHNYAVNEML